MRNLGYPGGSDGKESTRNVGGLGSVPGLGRSPGGGNGTQSSILAWRIPMDRGAWQDTVYGVAKSQTRLSTAQRMRNLHVIQMDLFTNRNRFTNLENGVMVT